MGGWEALSGVWEYRTVMDSMDEKERIETAHSGRLGLGKIPDSTLTWTRDYLIGLEVGRSALHPRLRWSVRPVQQLTD